MKIIYPKGAERRKSDRYMNWDEVPLIMGIQELSQLTGYNQNTLKLYCAKGTASLIFHAGTPPSSKARIQSMTSEVLGFFWILYRPRIQ